LVFPTACFFPRNFSGANVFPTAASHRLFFFFSLTVVVCSWDLLRRFELVDKLNPLPSFVGFPSFPFAKQFCPPETESHASQIPFFPLYVPPTDSRVARGKDSFSPCQNSAPRSYFDLPAAPPSLDARCTVNFFFFRISPARWTERNFSPSLPNSFQAQPRGDNCPPHNSPPPPLHFLFPRGKSPSREAVLQQGPLQRPRAPPELPPFYPPPQTSFIICRLPNFSSPMLAGLFVNVSHPPLSPNLCTKEFPDHVPFHLAMSPLSCITTLPFKADFFPTFDRRNSFPTLFSFYNTHC